MTEPLRTAVRVFVPEEPVGGQTIVKFGLRHSAVTGVSRPKVHDRRSGQRRRPPRSSTDLHRQKLHMHFGCLGQDAEVVHVRGEDVVAVERKAHHGRVYRVVRA